MITVIFHIFFCCCFQKLKKQIPKVLRKQSSEFGVILGQTEERNTTSESSSGIYTNQMYNSNTYASLRCSAPRLKVNVHSKSERIWQFWKCGWQLPPPHYFHRRILRSLRRQKYSSEPLISALIFHHSLSFPWNFCLTFFFAKQRTENNLGSIF